MQQMQKVFQRSHYMYDTNQDQEWSQGDDHNDQEQPFQLRRIMAPLILLSKHSMCSIKADILKC